MRIIRLAWPQKADPAATGEIFLSPAQARHGVQVLRLAAGSLVEMVGPAGLAPARVTTSSGKGGHHRLGIMLIGPWLRSEAATGPRLALSLISGPRFDWAVEKAVELGASALIPLICARTKAGDARPGPARESRWRRLAEEARKQCGRASEMEISPVMEFGQLLALSGPGFFLNPAAGEDSPLAVNSPLLSVGPEGGFSPAEEKAFLEAGFRPWRLGSTVLRAETAALAALAVLNAATTA
ncbi:16S rRNA (uracil(1498)-N(3))-methyltransferase [Deltaproteobacteria bacterium OttesenSCG-928-M10]|nr:16S rRNA (uracil(1498)-N(3))-methyltransferase [Deltaproteobacteria bacterium OttesenSCG-928-M10]